MKQSTFRHESRPKTKLESTKIGVLLSYLQDGYLRRPESGHLANSRQAGLRLSHADGRRSIQWQVFSSTCQPADVVTTMSNLVSWLRSPVRR